jgi:hypothetical protein
MSSGHLETSALIIARMQGVCTALIEFNSSSIDSAALQLCAGGASPDIPNSTFVQHCNAIAHEKLGRKDVRFSKLGAKLREQTNCAKEDARAAGYMQVVRVFVGIIHWLPSPACCCRNTSRASPLQLAHHQGPTPSRSFAALTLQRTLVLIYRR